MLETFVSSIVILIQHCWDNVSIVENSPNSDVSIRPCGPRVLSEWRHTQAGCMWEVCSHSEKPDHLPSCTPAEMGRCLTESPAPSPLPSQKDFLSLGFPCKTQPRRLQAHLAQFWTGLSLQRPWGSQQTRAQNGSSLIHFHVRTLELWSASSRDTWDSNYSMPLLLLINDPQNHKHVSANSSIWHEWGLFNAC